MGQGVPAYHGFQQRVPDERLRRWERQLRKLFLHPEPEVRLWATLLRESILDLRRRAWWPRHAAYYWFDHDGDELGSFRWVCRELDLHDWATIRQDVFKDMGLLS